MEAEDRQALRRERKRQKDKKVRRIVWIVLAVLLAAIVILKLCEVDFGNLRGGSDCNIFKRRVSDNTVKKAGVIICINLMLGLVGTLAICHLQNGAPISDVLFEVYSAIGTVGMSTGITRELTNASRLIITLLMYCGRVGSMTFAIAFTERKVTAHISLPEEKITVG